VLICITKLSHNIIQSVLNGREWQLKWKTKLEGKVGEEERRDNALWHWCSMILSIHSYCITIITFLPTFNSYNYSVHYKSVTYFLWQIFSILLSIIYYQYKTLCTSSDRIILYILYRIIYYYIKHLNSVYPPIY
jgi:hypothetical protein